MSIFGATLNQICFLFGFIVIGYILIKAKILPESAAAVLSKLENTIFIPALVMGTFIENFTVARIREAGVLLSVSFGIGLLAILFAIFVSKLIVRDKYIQKIYTYGLSFSNFGFMGNAVVSFIFPDIFFEYLIFTLPLWIYIYLWGVPKLLIAQADQKQSFKESLKALLNPMFVAMLLGMVIGLFNISLPSWAMSLITVSGDCMSPIAMILTGVVVSKISLKKTFTNASIYIVSAVRLLVMPAIFIAVAQLVQIPQTIYICTLCSLAMPLGLNTIVIPSALGKDTTVASGMALISHLLAVVTIPLVFMFI